MCAIKFMWKIALWSWIVLLGYHNKYQGLDGSNHNLYLTILEAIKSRIMGLAM